MRAFRRVACVVLHTYDRPVGLDLRLIQKAVRMSGSTIDSSASRTIMCWSIKGSRGRFEFDGAMP